MFNEIVDLVLVRPGKVSIYSLESIIFWIPIDFESVSIGLANWAILWDQTLLTCQRPPGILRIKAQQFYNYLPWYSINVKARFLLWTGSSVLFGVV